MKINTTRFGEIEIDENLIFNFLEPILGYENLSKYFLLDYAEDSPFKWLQSAENPEVAFPVTFPSFFGIDYQFEIPEEKVKLINITDSKKLLSFNIACVPGNNPKDSTVNLAGPIIVNIENKKSMQLVLTNPAYSVKHKLFAEVPAKREEAKT